MPIRLLLAAALLGYAAAWLLLLYGFRRGGRPPVASLFLVGLPAALHGGALIAFWVAHGTPPLVGFGPASATLALAIVLGLLLAIRAADRWTAALLVLPFAVALTGVGLWAGVSPTQPATTFRGVWFVLHVVAVLGGYASLLLGSVAAAMYLLQFRALKRKEFGNVFRSFPSLESLDRMNGIGLAGGLAALAIGLLAGWSFTLTFGRGLALGDPDVVFGLLTWVAYGAALGVRWLPGGRGTRSATVSVLAFAMTGAAFLTFRILDPSSEFLL